ncbi:CRISPR-associated protein Cas4 [Thermicanus aegyptius]|uniref:CRISPR-associated protein Cas4 n=1 Tax=Thermicanus aegyptius TaxID=94009 RepID=UPI000419D84C|nr:CRISPR-associated protein Cas4 [Thermicanus aegyptius]
MFEVNMTDLKQFIFCPRYIYFTYVQPVKKVPTFKMEDARETHLENVKKERRRGLRRYRLVEGERFYGYSVFAESLNLRGKIDILIDTHAEEGQRFYPVEVKDTLRGVRNNIKYQLVGYALALEEMTGTHVEKGFIYLIPEEKAVLIEITPKSKEYVRKAIRMIRRIAEGEIFPNPRSVKRCWTCELRRYCNDLDIPSRVEQKERERVWIEEIFGNR